jgi:hypothetical protein
MINQLRLSIAQSDVATRQEASTMRPSAHKHGLASALVGATSFGAFFPLILGSTIGAAGVDTLVLIASGAWFGIVSGGTIGYAIGHRGR